MQPTVSSNGVTSSPKATPAYSLVIPAHDEERRIGKALAGYLDAFSDGEVILVCNGCNDATAEVARKIAGERTNLRIVWIDHAIGKGGAVRAGFLAARAPIVGYVDADGATPPEEIRRLFGLVRGQVAGVIGSRWTQGARVVVAQPFLRRLASRAFNLLVRIFFGLPFHDTQCGAKVFRADAVREIAGALEVANFAFDIDILHALRRRGHNIVEVPTEWRDVDDSRVDLPQASKQMLLALVRLRLRYSLFRYVIPIFDRLWPTKPLRVRAGLSILFLNWRDPRHPQAGGAERYLHEIGKRLVARGHRVEWLTAGFPGAAREDTLDGIKIHRVGGRISVYLLLPLAYLRKFRDRFDAIVDAENGIPFFSPFFSLKPKVCLVFHVHQRVFRRHLPFPFSSMFCWIEAVMMPLAYSNSRFIAISSDTKHELNGLGVPEEHIDLVVSGVDPNLQPLDKSVHPTLAYVGRLKAYKRIESLIDTIPELSKRFPTLSVIVAGTGDHEPALRAHAAARGVAERIVFEGFVTEARKREILASTWLFVMPSEMEGWGLTIVEAAACGTPSVGYDVPGVREAIADGRTGAIVPNGSDLTPVLAALLGDDERRGQLSRGALLGSLAYSWDRTADGLLESLQRSVLQEYGRLVGSNAADETSSPINVYPNAERRRRPRGKIA
jgi:glycosyltransferase involved in cell wall biosynthesis